MQEAGLEQQLLLLEYTFQKYLDEFEQPPFVCINCYHLQDECSCRVSSSLAPMILAISKLTSQLNFGEAS